MPTRRRTWAPAGPTPLITSTYKPDRRSTLAVLPVSPKRQPLGLDCRWQPRNCQAIAGADFRRALLRRLRGHVVLRWDRRTMHRGPAIEAVCQAHPRPHLEEVPAYAPELNPPAHVWNDFKGHMANSLLRDTRELGRRLRVKVRRVCPSPANRRSFILASELPSPPWERSHYLC